MRTKDFTLVSGLGVRFRGIQISDDGVLVDSDKTFIEVYHKLLTDCTIEVLNPGACESAITADGKVDWDKVPYGVFLDAVLALRMASNRDGHIYAVDVPCSRCPKTINWEIDLRKMEDGGDVIDYPIEPEVAEKLRNGELFDVEISGKTVLFSMRTVADARYIESIDKKDIARARIIKFMRQIKTISDIEIRLDYEQWLKELCSDDAQELQDSFDDIEPGIDSNVSIKCNHCGMEFETSIPFDLTFILPQNRKRKRRAQRLAQIRKSRHLKAS